jgi:hypothetical protein
MNFIPVRCILSAAFGIIFVIINVHVPYYVIPQLTFTHKSSPIDTYAHGDMYGQATTTSYNLPFNFVSS